MKDKLQNVFKKLRGKGRLTEEDVKVALKEVKMALLEADVSFKVVKQFIKAVQERAIGQDVMNGLNPGQMVIKIVNDELVSLMGSETTESALRPAGEITVIRVPFRSVFINFPEEKFRIISGFIRIKIMRCNASALKSSFFMIIPPVSHFLKKNNNNDPL